MNEQENNNYTGYENSNTTPNEADCVTNSCENVQSEQKEESFNQPTQFGYAPSPAYNSAQANNPNPYGYMPEQNAQFNYAYSPNYEPPKKSKAGKTILIIVAVIIAFIVGFIGVSLVSTGIFSSTEKRIEQYNESGKLEDLIFVCDSYDSMIDTIDEDEAKQAEGMFEEALKDTKKFLRAYNSSKCVDFYASNEDCYRTFVTDYLCILLINGKYEKYASVFADKMLETSPTGNYYFDSYELSNYIELEYIEITDERQEAIIKGFDKLIEASTDDETRTLNLQEYYDFCEAIGAYEQADKIEAQLAENK